MWAEFATRFGLTSGDQGTKKYPRVPQVSASSVLNHVSALFDPYWANRTNKLRGDEKARFDEAYKIWQERRDLLRMQLSNNSLNLSLFWRAITNVFTLMKVAPTHITAWRVALPAASMEAQRRKKPAPAPWGSNLWPWVALFGLIYAAAK